MDKTLVRLNADYQIKNIIIRTLREHFAQYPESSYYRYVADEFGFPDLERTQIVITDFYTYDSKFLPALMVKYDSGRHYPIGIDQNWTTIKYRWDEDAYGNCRHVPEAYVWAGGIDSALTVQIAAEDTITREELSDIVFIALQHLEHQNLRDHGVFIKNVSIGAEIEEPWANDYIYLNTVSFEVFSEWRREVPIGHNLLEKIAYKYDEEGFDYTSGHTLHRGDLTCKRWIDFGIRHDRPMSCPPSMEDQQTGDTFTIHNGYIIVDTEGT